MNNPSSQQWKRTTDLNINLQQILEQMAAIPENNTISEVDRFLLGIDLPIPSKTTERKQ